MTMLVHGWSVVDVAKLTGIGERTIRDIRARMCAKAERDGRRAMLKLLAGELRRAA